MDQVSFGGVITPENVMNYNLDKINKNMLGTATPVLKSSNDYSSIPIDFQGKQPQCGAHAGARLKNIFALKAGKPITHSSPRFNTKNIKAIDGYTNEQGTDINSIFKAGRNNGICSFDLTGNDVTLSLDDYTNLAVTQGMITEALGNEFDAEAFIYAPTFDQICDTIDAHGAAIALFRVGKNMYTAKDGTVTWDADKILPLSPDNFPMTDGHFMTLENYDKTLGRIYGANEWGTTWGDKGYYYFDQNYIPFIIAIGTAVEKKNVPPEALPKFIFVRDMTMGFTGADVKALQKILETSGFLVMPKDVAYGYFGGITKNALMRYQMSKGIPATGYFGPITRKYVNSL